MYKEWGPICWIFLHTIIEKLKDEFFYAKKNVIIDIIHYTCNNLPCPICRKHASNYLKINKINKCNTRNDLRMYMFNFHNVVNRRLNKNIEKNETLEKYKNCNFRELLKRFNLVFKKQYLFTKVMDGWQRKKIAEKIMEKINENIMYFNH